MGVGGLWIICKHGHNSRSGMHTDAYILPQPVYFTSLRNCHTHRDRKILWTRRAYAHTNMAVALPLLRVNKLNSSVIILCHCVPCSNLQATSQCKQALLSFDKIALLISRRKKTYFTLMHFLFHFLYPPPPKKKKSFAKRSIHLYSQKSHNI